MSKVELLAGELVESETSRAAQACNDYLRMGPGRSLRKLAKKYGKTRQNTTPTDSFDTLANWSTTYVWQARAAAYDAELDATKTEKRRAVMEHGLALDYERVTKLKKLAAYLSEQIADPTNVWVPDVKQIGSGEYAERVDLVRFNAPLIAEYRATLADLAAETGGRKLRAEIGGMAGQPLEHVVRYDLSKLSREELLQLRQIVAKTSNESADAG